MMRNRAPPIQQHPQPSRPGIETVQEAETETAAADSKPEATEATAGKEIRAKDRNARTE
ncbi:hypothetical protein [Komagataeibacter saccharivorans]|uniref:hypothetical protein n=1 Tax=Komagataeibacter saccharivorans TaxID=265959 RepID=UPI0015E8DB5A|nr:hypothetical protein [Komagataeibacter saccharivorans]